MWLHGVVIDNTASLLVALGHCIAERRRRAGLSQEALAERTGLHRTYISSAERGRRNLTINSLRALANGVECKPSELLAEVGS